MPNYRFSRRALLLAAAAGAPVFAVARRATAQKEKPPKVTEPASLTANSLLSLVNPLQGTNSDGGFSRGNTLAIVARPFGMTHWALQSRAADRWFFHPHDSKLMGIRATHQPSPWMADYGNFTVMAAVVEEGVTIDPATYAASYRPENLTIRPDYVSVLFDNGLRMEMTPTERCAAFRFTPPAGKKMLVWVNAHSEARYENKHELVRYFAGRSNLNSGGVEGDFGCHFVAYLDDEHEHPLSIPPVLIPSAAGIVAVEVTPNVEGTAPGVTLLVGTSFISEKQADQNVSKECALRVEETFEVLRQKTAEIWEKTLGVVQVEGGTVEQRRTFYTCLYRTQLFPRELHEFDASGKPIHYSPYDGKVHPGVLYGDSGFWDTYRTQFPLLSLLQPARYGEMVQGFINAFHEGGWLPQWPSPGYRAVMIGTHIDAVIADAVVKNLPGFDREAAYAGLLRDAETPGDAHDRFGRVGLTDYLTLGYVPSDKFNKATSRSLDYYYDDFCVSQVAHALGKTDDARRLRERALGYRHVYDASVGFMWGKHADGSWQPNFDEWAWGGPYVEGGPWQSTWAVPHDPAGLMTLMGGRAAFVAKLDRMLLQSPRFSPGTYGGVIHEMAEMAAVDFGQYDQGNQPVHLALSLFASAGCPAKMHYWTRRVMAHLFSAEQFAGDEDNGEMSAWYVLNALGLFPQCPGEPSYVLGSPIFPRATVHLANDKTLEIDAPATSETHVYAGTVTWNGAAHSALRIDHAALASGGRLQFTMTDRPAPRPLADADLPHSLSPYPPLEPAADLFASTLRIACGGEGDGKSWVGDCFFDGGETIKRDNPVATDAAPHPAPVAIYQSERYGTFRYRIPLPMLPHARGYTVRLHFAEIADTEVGKRLIDVTLNGTPVLRRFDLFAEAGLNKAIVHDYPHILPDRDGAIEIAFATPADSPDRNAKVSGIEVLPEA